MKRLFFSLLALTLFWGTNGLTPLQAQEEDYNDEDTSVSLSLFHGSLQAYGEWSDDPTYGEVWRPNVDSDWRPYAVGQWAYTDVGWTWVSDEPWGWATYHYGRWVNLEDVGWAWVPGYEWAPAWVSWRYSDDYCGWAPLPPEAHFYVGIHFGNDVDTRYHIRPDYYNFVPVRSFGERHLNGFLLARGRNNTILNRTTNVTNITFNGNSGNGRLRNAHVINNGPALATVNAHARTPIHQVQLAQDTSAPQGQGRAGGGSFNARQQGQTLHVYAPALNRPTQGGATQRRAAASTTTPAAVPASVPATTTTHLHSEFHHQAAAAENAPVADLPKSQRQATTNRREVSEAPAQSAVREERHSQRLATPASEAQQVRSTQRETAPAQELRQTQRQEARPVFQQPQREHAAPVVHEQRPAAAPQAKVAPQGEQHHGGHEDGHHD